AALLVENRAYQGLAGLIVVASTPEVQEARLVARDSLTLAEARARIAAQAPLEAKLAVATWVIHNDGQVEHLTAQIDQVIAEIEAKHGPIAVPVAAAPATRSGESRECALVTGFPAFTAKRMIAKLLATEPETKLYVLARDKFAPEASALLEQLGASDRAEVLVGDICDMDVGLSSNEYRALSKELTWIHHLAGIYFMGIDDATARRVNVGGTRTVIELARDAARLERVVHWSTAMVSGNRHGTIYEEDLEAGQKFHNGYERTKFEAEQIVRNAMRQLPITVIRPSMVVGDSKTGDIDKLDGPYYLMTLIATNASGLRLPLLGRGDAPLHIVPIDYVIDAAWQVARSAGAAGKTFHLVDPNPMTAREVFEGVAKHAHTAVPRGSIPRPLARAVLRTPGLARLGRGPLAFLDMLDHAVHYDQTNTSNALAGTTLHCPPLSDYLAVLVKHVLEVTREAAPLEHDELFDPLE
ncbi:MAG TPA: dephospho-CoA kinase, partial [Kofleriaceae bacterium]|nr:dephospho-CoA kinase [Kofleriaceae bacterium]